MSSKMVFKTPMSERDSFRAALDATYRADETACIKANLKELELSDDSRDRIHAYARSLVESVREESANQGGIDAFLHEYGLATHEGVLLMCIAEALLRIPDSETRESLIRDKLGSADWKQHLGQSRSLFVNASTWALMLTGRVIGGREAPGRSPDAALRRLVARVGEPVVRESVNQAMRIMGRQFVMGREIETAISRAEKWEKRGYSYSYDMLGEAARTMDDAKDYFRRYKHAIQKIGEKAGGRGPINGPGISVKLSGLHPRYEVGNYERVMDELMPRLRALCVDAAHYDIGLNIDAEEADRLDISLDCIEAISGDPELKDWQGFGVVVQAYQRRAPAALDLLADMGRRHGRRFMVRLVKGAYWDMEIKRAQEMGFDDYPVFTRKVNTDVSYLACARKLFANTDVFYPQLATHNAHSISSVLEFAGKNRDFEFQRLHGMGEDLYERVIEHDKVGVGCRIYAPVGQHEDLLAYLVRRLLENGANSSFINRIQDEGLDIDELIADPAQQVRALTRIPHPRIPQPRDLFGPQRRNAKGVDYTDRSVLQRLKGGMEESANQGWRADPIIGGKVVDGQDNREVRPPHDRSRVLGETSEATEEQLEQALQTAHDAAREWAATPVEQRAACLDRAADLMEERMTRILGLLVAEVGKTLNDAVSEVREAIDFCRYYALTARENLGSDIQLRAPIGIEDKVQLRGGGVFTCISPWNLPFAIFNGQVTAALVAGNAVLAKPAEQSPLIAAEAVKLLHEAGVPSEVLHLVPGDGRRVGGRLTADPRVTGVCFTGSTQTAQAINRALSRRDGPIPPLIAETGGQNAMIIDSTALTEQVTRDVVMSAFQNAGQRCSALRVLFVQEDVAQRTMDMIAGAMDELSVSDPQLISTDVGPVIDEDAQSMVNNHIKRMLGEATEIKRAKLGPATQNGSFVTPAAFEIDSIDRLKEEIFGPVLHIVRYRADRLDKVLEAINATGYGLTMGVHSRIDDMWKKCYQKARVGNNYVNRNQIGAIVGVQPFGGQGLSGTGPKAGGPLYLQRFVTDRPANGAAGEAETGSAGTATGLDDALVSSSGLNKALENLSKSGGEWEDPAPARAAALEAAAEAFESKPKAFLKLDAGGESEGRRGADFLRVYAVQAETELTEPMAMPGPTGERNELSFWPRGPVACLAVDGQRGLGALIAQAGAALAAGNRALLWHPDAGAAAAVARVLHDAGVPKDVVMAVEPANEAALSELVTAAQIQVVAFAGEAATARAISMALADAEGPIRSLVLFRERPEEGAGVVGQGQPVAGNPDYLHRFVHERSLSIDTTASGGNASLMSIEDGPSLPGEGG